MKTILKSMSLVDIKAVLEEDKKNVTGFLKEAITAGLYKDISDAATELDKIDSQLDLISIAQKEFLPN